MWGVITPSCARGDRHIERKTDNQKSFVYSAEIKKLAMENATRPA